MVPNHALLPKSNARQRQFGCCIRAQAPGRELQRPATACHSAVTGPLSPEQIDEFYEQGMQPVPHIFLSRWCAPLRSAVAHSSIHV